MRILRAFIVPVITGLLVFILDRPLGSLPALGKLLDPVSGWSANAEPVSEDYNKTLAIEGVDQNADVWFEDRMVPHVRASSDRDIYFIQGYLHAYFRLWQMDFQTRAAAGKLGEIIGEKWVKDEQTGQRENAILEFDRTQRRKGMVYAAEKSLAAMESDPRTKQMLDAYTAGVNYYISSLNFKRLPLEYKLMGYEPESWTNLKSALLLKYMADDLTGYTEDFPLTVLRNKLPAGSFERLFPQRIPESSPVIPQGTNFDVPSFKRILQPGDSLWAEINGTSPVSSKNMQGYADGIGSNSWVLSGSKTKTGVPILSNDPHLGLNLPSLWFEMQLQAPGLNVYGVSLPGAPGIVIGFNDSVSWGFTNNYRDVKDFYEIDFIDKDFYRFDDVSRAFDKRIEIIKIKGRQDWIDTVYYTLHGPVMYDESFPSPFNTGKMYAMQWMAHRETNELLSLYLLNRAKDYISFVEAILHFECPAQNMVYADRSGNIAMWGQGQFINKWKDQGRYVMKGNMSKTLWQEDIPMTENPHVLNPAQGYLASANQVTTDTTYPYWYNGYFYDFRAWRINELLSQHSQWDIAGNMQLQQDVFSVLARNTAALINKLTTNPVIDNGWNYTLNASSENATRFQVFWNLFYDFLWQDMFKSAGLRPSPEVTMQILKQDTGLTSALFQQLQVAALSGKKMLEDSMGRLNGHTAWAEVKKTQLTHLARLDAFSFKELTVGGWGNTVNAVKKTHGPSWRMIVEMGRDDITAYGVYPGGQSGNPGSRYYGNFVADWTDGRYYKLNFLSYTDKQNDKVIKYTWTISTK